MSATEDPTIMRLNLAHFQRALELEPNTAKRQRLLALIDETNEKLRGVVRPAEINSSARVADAVAGEHDARITEQTEEKVFDSAALLHELSERLTSLGNYLEGINNLVAKNLYNSKPILCEIAQKASDEHSRSITALRQLRAWLRGNDDAH